MLIYLCGRKNCGKTTLCDELIKRNYTKVSFADKLKESISYLYGVEINSLSNPIFKETQLDNPWKWNSEIFNKLKQYLKIKASLEIKDRVFNTPRECLQYIGTDILRAIDTDFHLKYAIKKIKYLIKQGKNICLDDVRFINEKKSLDSDNSFICQEPKNDI